MNDTLQRIGQVFNEHELLGNHDFAEDEYSFMMDSVGTLNNNFDKNSSTKNYKSNNILPKNQPTFLSKNQNEKIDDLPTILQT